MGYERWIQYLRSTRSLSNSISENRITGSAIATVNTRYNSVCMHLLNFAQANVWSVPTTVRSTSDALRPPSVPGAVVTTKTRFISKIVPGVNVYLQAGYPQDRTAAHSKRGKPNSCAPVMSGRTSCSPNVSIGRLYLRPRCLNSPAYLVRKWTLFSRLIITILVSIYIYSSPRLIESY